jgi:hypothetical protein
MKGIAMKIIVRSFCLTFFICTLSTAGQSKALTDSRKLQAPQGYHSVTDPFEIYALLSDGWIESCLKTIADLLCPNEYEIPDDRDEDLGPGIVDLNTLCPSQRDACLAGCTGGGFGAVRCVEDCHAAEESCEKQVAPDQQLFNEYER